MVKDGEIFIKNGPDIFFMNDEERILINQLEKNSSSIEEEICLDILKGLNSVQGMKDYSGCENFWISNIDGEIIKMIEQSDITDGIRLFDNEQLLNASFTKLTDFLDNSKYIGKYFRRIAPIKGTVNSGYMDNDERAFAIYTNDKQMLVRYKFLSEITYKMVSPRFLEDGQYEYYGSYSDEYLDKNYLIDNIKEQINNYDKQMKLSRKKNN